MTVNDIVNLDSTDLMKMNKTQLQQVLKDVNRATSRRNRDLRKARLTRQSPAYRGFQESGGTINTSDQQSINEMRKEFFRGQKFLKSKTSTVTGSKKYIKKMQDITGEKSIAKNNEFWDIFGKFKEIAPALFNAIGSSRTANVIRSVTGKGGGLQDVLDQANSIYQDMYQDFSEVDWGEPDAELEDDFYDNF